MIPSPATTRTATTAIFQAQCVEVADLSQSSAVKYEVVDKPPMYGQYISSSDQKLMLPRPVFEAEQLMLRKTENETKSWFSLSRG